PRMLIRHLGLSWTAYARAVLLRPALLTAVLLAAYSAIRTGGPAVVGWLDLVLHGACACAVAGLGLVGLCMNGEERRRFIADPLTRGLRSAGLLEPLPDT